MGNKRNEINLRLCSNYIEPRQLQNIMESYKKYIDKETKNSNIIFTLMVWNRLRTFPVLIFLSSFTFNEIATGGFLAPSPHLRGAQD